MAGLFIGAIIMLIVNLVVASYMQDVAFTKGYDTNAHAFAMCFWLGIIGVLYVIALPDLVARANQERIIEQQEKMIKCLCGEANINTTESVVDDELPPL